MLIGWVMLMAAASAQGAGRCGQHPWCDTSLSPGQRAALLVNALTPAERIGLLAGDHSEGVGGGAGTHTGAADGVPRVGLPPFFQTDGPIGVRQGKATALPAGIALGASFDRALARTYGEVVGNEAKHKGNDLVYGPTVNILRTPLWGRAFETYGEDPFLTTRTGVAWIRGLQAQGVMANVKHFAANNQEGLRLLGGTIAGSRFKVDVRVGERTEREIYLPAFEAAVKEANVASVMCSYNRLDGLHSCENPMLLDRILRREWGFKGLVLADYGASKHVDTGLRAGLDYEPFPFLDFDGGENYTPTAVNAALLAGRTDQQLVDAAVRRLLRTLFARGFFDRPAYLDDDSKINKSAHRRFAQRVEERGTVLLKNKGVLPLDAKRLSSVAVIGADADRFVNGGGSSNIDPYSFTSLREGITNRAGSGVEVRYDSGANLDDAAAVAHGAQAAVVVVADVSSEGVDKPCLGLGCGNTADPDQLVERVAAANPNTIVVLQTSGPVLTPWRKRVDAILEAWYPGEAAGSAIARVLFGDVDPGGRLPATFPRRENDLPTAKHPKRYPGVNDVVHYSEGLLVGYRWYDRKRIRPAFPFGFGLSYTRFTLRHLHVRSDRYGVGATVSVELVNKGRRKGIAVPQLYLGSPDPKEPARQLKGFASLELRPGHSKRVTLRLDRRAFSSWSTHRHRWRVTPGCYRILVGSSSRTIDSRARLSVGGAGCARPSP